MKLIYFAKESWEEAYVRDKLPGVEIIFHVGTTKDHTAADADADALSVFVNSPLGAPELARYPNLKLIATRSTGFDHIDKEEVRRRHIAVANVPTYGVTTVAEFAFALLLALSRRICDAHVRVTQTGSFSQNDLRGFDLEGKTIGIVGCGHIGAHAAKIANGFGMRVIVFDAYHNDDLAHKLNFTYASLEELLAQSDIITLHVPYNEHTHHLINKENVSRIKKGAYLINTARGAVIETAALVSALKEEIIAGAGLDVLEEEGDLTGNADRSANPHQTEEQLEIMRGNHYLIKHPRVIVTPHIAFDSGEAIRRILDTTIENIKSYQSGTPQNLLPL